ncbi:MAG: hypothetical protein KGR46_06190 [Verrucomicrobia bacterium]|nr:hypothetical protein [Verrucomicrobiota bacterium]
MNSELANHPGWKLCTFEGAELNSLLLGQETTFREKLSGWSSCKNSKAALQKIELKVFVSRRLPASL